MHGGERRFLKVVEYMRGHDARFYVLEEDPLFGTNRYSSFKIPTKYARSTIRLIITSLRIARGQKCDAVYVYSVHSYYSLIPSVATSILLNLPLFVVVHDDENKLEDRSGLRKLLTRRGRNGPRLRYNFSRVLFILVKRIGLARAAACFCPSITTADYVTRTFRTRTVVVSGNGVDETFVPDSKEPKRYDAAFLGRLDEGKGLSCLLEAWRIVNSTRPSSRLVIIGSSPDGGDTYRQMARKFGLGHCVEFTGFVSDELIKKYLQSSKMFVFPSVSEGFGLAVAEAMSVGLPCVVSDIPALRENFSDAAVLVPPGDAISFSQAILSLLSDEKELAKRGKSCLELSKKFNWDVVASKEAETIRRKAGTSG